MSVDTLDETPLDKAETLASIFKRKDAVFTFLGLGHLIEWLFLDLSIYLQIS